MVTLADLSHLQVETDDLTELDVVEISIGQKATIVPDAIQEIEIKGEVIAISEIYEEKRGDITYTALILIEDPDPRLRWGMTVAVTFEE